MRKFVDYIENKYIKNGIAIYKDSDKEELIKTFVECGLSNYYVHSVILSDVIKFMKNRMGYDVSHGRLIIDNKQYDFILFKETNLALCPCTFDSDFGKSGHKCVYCDGTGFYEKEIGEGEW